MAVFMCQRGRGGEQAKLEEVDSGGKRRLESVGIEFPEHRSPFASRHDSSPSLFLCINIHTHIPVLTGINLTRDTINRLQQLSSCSLIKRGRRSEMGRQRSQGTVRTSGSNGWTLSFLSSHFVLLIKAWCTRAT